MVQVNQRDLNLRFCHLRLSDRNEIGRTLGLIDEESENMFSDFESAMIMLNRAFERGLLSQLADKIETCEKSSCIS